MLLLLQQRSSIHYSWGIGLNTDFRAVLYCDGVVMNEENDNDLDEADPKPELYQKSVKDIRERMEIEICYDRTFIVALAIHNDQGKNSLTKIHCRKGLPISGYLYDLQTDSYHIECHDYVPLGYIPVSFYHKMPGVGNWKQRIPMPEITLRRYMTSNQKHDLRQFKSTYKGGQYSIHFMQIIDCF